MITNVVDINVLLNSNYKEYYKNKRGIKDTVVGQIWVDYQMNNVREPIIVNYQEERSVIRSGEDLYEKNIFKKNSPMLRATQHKEY